jgi:hypothetical protein
MAVLFGGQGYGQIEPNRCSFLHDGNIESQCKANVDLENGWIVKVDKVAGTVTTADELKGLVGLCYTAERIYERATGLKNFSTKANEYPRVGYLKTGDVYTTNAVTSTTYTQIGSIATAITSTPLYVGADNVITATSATDGDFVLQIVEETTMPDGQPAVKIQVI